MNDHTVKCWLPDAKAKGLLREVPIEGVNEAVSIAVGRAHGCTLSRRTERYDASR